MNAMRTKFSDAILIMNCRKMIYALSKGAIINTGNSKHNTINFAIRVLLDHHVDKFDLNFLKVLFDAGGIVCNANTINNTFEMIINKIDDYVDKAKNNNNCDIAEKNVLELLNLIVSKGATICNTNIYSYIAFMGLGLEIVKLLHKHQMLVHSDIILNYAIKSNNVEIIYEIIMKGAKPNNTRSGYLYWDVCYNTFVIFWNNFSHDDINKFNRTIYLLLCSGATIHDDLFKSKPSSYYKKKITSCYDLLQRKKIQTDEESHDRNELKKELIKTMKELMEGPVSKHNIIEQIDIGMQRYIPIPCIDIIYEYQHSTSLVQFIDWSEY